MTSGDKGLMWNNDSPGDGEGNDIKIFGSLIYIILNWMLVLKVYYESASLIHGQWPAFTCKDDGKDGFWSRVAYTWHGGTWLSIGWNFFFFYIYERIGMRGYVQDFSPYVSVASHLLHTRSVSIVLMFFVPISAMAIDVIGKVISNMFFPSQTQIHREKENLQLAGKEVPTKRKLPIRGVETC